MGRSRILLTGIIITDPLSYCRTLVYELQSRAGYPAYLSDKSFREPDFTFGKRSLLLPTLVGKVSYNRHFTRPQLEAKYKAYITDSNSDDEVRIVICVDLYYAGTGDKIFKTARNLNRTAISVWIIRDGIIETMMDWVPLS